MDDSVQSTFHTPVVTVAGMKARSRELFDYWRPTPPQLRLYHRTVRVIRTL
jgi:hypothetical protein